MTAALLDLDHLVTGTLWTDHIVRHCVRCARRRVRRVILLDDLVQLVSGVVEVGLDFFDEALSLLKLGVLETLQLAEFLTRKLDECLLIELDHELSLSKHVDFEVRNEHLQRKLVADEVKSKAVVQ